MGSGYTCFVSAFAVFVSDKEIKYSKSQVLLRFNSVNTIESFLDIGLVQKSITTGSENSTENMIYEIDISNKEDLKKRLGVSKLDCYPILWVKSQPITKLIEHTLKQHIAAKYMVIKLIDSYKNNLNDNNIDMYNLSLQGIRLDMPEPHL